MYYPIIYSLLFAVVMFGMDWLISYICMEMNKKISYKGGFGS